MDILNTDDTLVMKSIYKIFCKDENIPNIYIGQTINLDRRTKEHKHACNNGINKQKVHLFIIQNGGWENWDIIEIERVCINNANERELFWISNLHSNLNIQYTIIKEIIDDKNNYHKKYNTLYYKHKKEMQLDNRKKYNLSNFVRYCKYNGIKSKGK